MAGDSSKKNGVSWIWWGVFAILVVGYFGFNDPLSYPRLGSRGYLILLCNDGKHLVGLAKLYAKDHQGAFPHDVRELKKARADVRLDVLLKSYRGDGQPLGWIYFNQINDKSAPDHPVFVSPLLQDTNGSFVRWFRFNVLKKANLLPTTPTRVVATADGNAMAMPEAEFQTLVAKHHLALPVASPVTK